MRHQSREFYAAIEERIWAEGSRFENIDEYVQSLPVEAREPLKVFIALVMAELPDFTPTINYNIPAVPLIPGGKRDQQIMIAGYKKHLGFCPGSQCIAALNKFSVPRSIVTFWGTTDLSAKLLKKNKLKPNHVKLAYT